MKKRKQKTTVYVSLEGKREKVFYDFLYDVYEPKNSNRNVQSVGGTGGTSSSILIKALRAKNNYDKVFAWFDEDVKLRSEDRASLKDAWLVEEDFSPSVSDAELQRTYNNTGRNPILIVSNPKCIEGFLIQLCNGSLPSQLTTKNCKDAFAGIIGTGDIDEEMEKRFYRSKFNKSSLEEKANASQLLQLILSIFR